MTYLYSGQTFDNQKDGYGIFWDGIVASDSAWRQNTTDALVDDVQDLGGWGVRVKVRIYGIHSADTPETDLPWAEITTPGGSQGGNGRTSTYTQGTIVTGIFDGENLRITGAKYTDPQTPLEKACKDSGFKPKSGFACFNGAYKVPNYAISPDGKLIEGLGVWPVQLSKDDQRKMKELSVNIPSPCEPFDMKGINADIKNLIKEIRNLRTELLGDDSFLVTSQSFINDVQSNINSVSAKISGYMKWIFEEIRKRTMQFVNKRINQASQLLYLNQRFALREAQATALDLIACLFNKILDRLQNIIANFLEQFINRFILTPICAVENFVSALIGNLLGYITGALNNILGPISNIIGTVIDITSDILNFVESLLDFLTCDVKQKCPTVKEWNFLSGAGDNGKNLTIDFNKYVENAKKIGSSLQSLTDIDNFNFNIDFNSVFNSLTCNGAPIFCGPPRVEFFGGGGSGAAGNAIITATGDILGVDVVSSGFGYNSAPFVSIVDDCGKGSRATAFAILGPVPTGIGTGGAGIGTTGAFTTGVVRVVMTDPGYGYLPYYNGDRGGDGDTWAKATDGTIRRSDGTYDPPYKPGQVMNVRIGDEVNLPGQGPYISTKDESITVPFVDPNSLIPTRGKNPSLNSGTYPVVSFICDFHIKDPGFGYAKTDKIIVEPSNGAELEPRFNSVGSLIDVKIVNAGIGFTEVPRVYIQSNTGFNAELVPVLCVNRFGNATDDDTARELQRYKGQLVSVVDCVGKF